MTNIDRIFAPASSNWAFVSFYVPPASGSYIRYEGAYQAVYVPPGCNFTSSPTKELFDRLADLKTKYSAALLPGSEVPSAKAFQDARDFVLTMPLARMVKPDIQVASDGEVNFQWSGPDFRIDLGFYGNDQFSFYAEKDGHQPILADAVPVKDGIPKDLVDFASAA